MADQQERSEFLKCFADRHLVRSLDKEMADLKPYLTPGARVFDVGCGPGSITVDVAAAVSPGEAVGIDPVQNNVEAARNLSRERQVTNVAFQVADGLDLPFENQTFDIVYSHTVLHYFHDPERAVREQKRVAKPGGWVIAAGVRDTGLVRRYPPCPAWDQVEEARAAFADRQREKPEEAVLSLGQTHTGRRCAHYFIASGLKELRIEVRPYRILYPGSDGMEPHPLDALPWSLPDVIGHYESHDRDCKLMIAEGLIDEEALRQAMKEAEAWYSHPGAFSFSAMIFAVGRAVGRDCDARVWAA